MNARSLLLASVMVFAVVAPGACAEPGRAAPLGLSVGPDGTLLKDGRPWRGIGVNTFSLFSRTLRDSDDTSCEAGLRVLAAHRIPFARFMCGGFWPVDMRLYREDRDEYFRRLDAVVRAAERHGVGLIPSLFWHMSTVPDLVGEPCEGWGNPESRTHAFMRTYTREVVTRYRSSPAVWGWEFGNEYNLVADLPNASQHRPKIVPPRGTPKTRSKRDELTHDMVRTALAEFAREVRRHDPYRIITSGNSIPRPTAWHQRAEKSWTKDTPEQYAEMLLGDSPDPMNVVSVHCYRENVERLPLTAEIAARAGKPLFVGEFGVEGPPSAESRKRFRGILALLEKHRVPLAALWVFDYGRQDGSWNVTATNGRAYQLRAIAEANERIRAGR